MIFLLERDPPPSLSSQRLPVCLALSLSASQRSQTHVKKGASWEERGEKLRLTLILEWFPFLSTYISYNIYQNPLQQSTTLDLVS